MKAVVVVSRGVDGFSRGREHMAVVSRAVVTVVSRESWESLIEAFVSGSRRPYRGNPFWESQIQAFVSGSRRPYRGNPFLESLIPKNTPSRES